MMPAKLMLLLIAGGEVLKYQTTQISCAEVSTRIDAGEGVTIEIREGTQLRVVSVLCVRGGNVNVEVFSAYLP